MLDTLVNAGGVPLYGFSYASHRQATLGTTTYYGIYCNTIGNVRVQSWWIRTLGFATAVMPTAWADAATNIERDYLLYALKNTHDYLNALVSFTGTVKFGTGGTNLTKSTDFSSAGVWPEAFSGSIEMTVPYMDGYVMVHSAIMAYLHQGTPTGTSIATWRDYWKNYNVKLWAYTGAHYLNDCYRLNALIGRPPPATVTDTTWSSEGDEGNPKLAIYGPGPVTLAFTSGVSTVVLSTAMLFQGTTRVANGSRFKLTPTNIETYANTGKSAPGNFDFTTWWYWKELTSTTGQLCSDAGLTLPITPSTSVSGLPFWVVPSNTLPTDTSGLGTFNGKTTTGGGSRIAIQYGIFRLCQAMGMADDANGNVTNAITNTAAIFNSLPGQTGYSLEPTWAYDNTR